MRSLRSFLTFLLAGALLTPFLSAAAAVIRNEGSTTLLPVARKLEDAYSRVDPTVVIKIKGGGSGTGIAALLNGTADIANASRKAKAKELAQARTRNVRLVEHLVGYDALAIYVRYDNPLRQIDFGQLKDIYAYNGRIGQWAQLGTEVRGCEVIVAVNRPEESGTHGYFQKVLLGGGSYKADLRKIWGARDVVNLVSQERCAIGYSGLGFQDPMVRPVCVSSSSDEACVMPAIKTASDGSYPLTRPLLMYTRGDPKGKTGEYLRWIKSDAGQCVVLRSGFVPVRPVNCDR